MNKDLRKDDAEASASVGFASENMILAGCHANKASSHTVVMDVAHMDLGIVVYYGVVEMLASRLLCHLDAVLCLRLHMD